MAYFRVKGADEYAEKVKKLSKNADKIIKRAVYDGGGVVADAVKPVSYTHLSFPTLRDFKEEGK